MGVTIINPKDRKEWLSHREMGIGSSEIATILGLNPFETPYQLWRRKRKMDPPKAETFAMRAGHYLEDAVSKFYSDATGVEIIKRSEGDWLIVNDEKPYLRVSPDRTYWIPGETRNSKNKGILECKTTQRNINEEDIPSHWFCQLQYQLGVAEFSQGALAWLVQGRDFGHQGYDFNEDFYAYLVEEAEKFWTVNIVGGEEPLLMRVEDVLTKFPSHTAGATKEASNGFLEDYIRLKGFRNQIQELEAQKKELEERMKLEMQDAEVVTSDGKTIVTWKSSKPSQRFDEKAFAAEHPDIFKEYLKEGNPIRRFIVK